MLGHVDVGTSRMTRSTDENIERFFDLHEFARDRCRTLLNSLIRSRSGLLQSRRSLRGAFGLSGAWAALPGARLDLLGGQRSQGAGSIGGP